MPISGHQFEEDLLGTNPNNRILNEIFTKTLDVARPNRVLVPTHGPFFTFNAELSCTVAGVPTMLTRDVDYKFIEPSSAAWVATGGKEVYQALLVTNTTLPAEFKFTYNTIGGTYQFDATTIETALELLANNTSAVDFYSGVRNKPLVYPTGPHTQPLNSIFGFGPIVVAIERMVDAMTLSNIPAFQALSNYVNTRIAQFEELLGDANINVPDILMSDLTAHNGSGTAHADIRSALQTITGAIATINSTFSQKVNIAGDVSMNGRKDFTHNSVSRNWGYAPIRVVTNASPTSGADFARMSFVTTDSGQTYQHGFDATNSRLGWFNHDGQILIGCDTEGKLDAPRAIQSPAASSNDTTLATTAFVTGKIAAIPPSSGGSKTYTSHLDDIYVSWANGSMSWNPNGSAGVHETTPFSHIAGKQWNSIVVPVSAAMLVEIDAKVYQPTYSGIYRDLDRMFGIYVLPCDSAGNVTNTSGVPYWIGSNSEQASHVSSVINYVHFYITFSYKFTMSYTTSGYVKIVFTGLESTSPGEFEPDEFWHAVGSTIKVTTS